MNEELKKDILDALDPFARVMLIRKKLPKEFLNANENKETPLRYILPGIWPTVGDLEKLFDLAEKIGWKSSYRK